MLQMSVPALCFYFQNFLIFIAITALDVTTYQVTFQLKLLITGLFSVLLLGMPARDLVSAGVEFEIFLMISLLGCSRQKAEFVPVAGFGGPDYWCGGRAARFDRLLRTPRRPELLVSVRRLHLCHPCLYLLRVCCCLLREGMSRSSCCHEAFVATVGDCL
eukprot:m.471369 g.471369  ORF g.471369 m.471369 type:complete len:160 (+) comp57100_c0_seq71:601-1080(+)